MRAEAMLADILQSIGEGVIAAGELNPQIFKLRQIRSDLKDLILVPFLRPLLFTR
jgi:hypothetical protein